MTLGVEEGQNRGGKPRQKSQSRGGEFSSPKTGEESKRKWLEQSQTWPKERVRASGREKNEKKRRRSPQPWPPGRLVDCSWSKKRRRTGGRRREEEQEDEEEKNRKHTWSTEMKASAEKI